MSVVETNDLGLASFMKMNGCKIVEVKSKRESKIFVFESNDKKYASEEAWKIRYLNSCCHRHDTELMMLRKLIKT